MGTTLETHVSNKSHDFFHKFIGVRDTICTDQTGKISWTSKRGNKYLLVTYAHDVNTILVYPLKTRKGK